MVDGLPVATVQRALFDEVVRLRPRRPRGSGRRSAMAAAAMLISVRLFAMYVAQRNAWTGVPHAREAVKLARDDCRSPQEHRMVTGLGARRGLRRARCATARCSTSTGRLIGVPDLLRPESRDWWGSTRARTTRTAPRHRKDVAREERFRDHGLEYFELVGGDIANRQVAVQRMRQRPAPGQVPAPRVAAPGPSSRRRGERAQRLSTSTWSARARPTTSGAPDAVSRDSP